MKRQLSPRQSGFTMVELMVGMVIGLVAVVVMFQVFETSEKFRRTTSGGGDATQNAALSVFLLERDARMAGYGLNYDPLLGCQARVYYEPTGQQIAFNLQPVSITNGLLGAPDEVTFVYGGGELAQFPGAMDQVYPTFGGGLANTFVFRDSRFQFRPGDFILAGEVPGTGQPMKDCTGYQVTGLPNPNPGQQGDRVLAVQGSYTDDAGAAKTTLYNPPNGQVPGPYTVNPYPIAVWQRKDRIGGRVFDLGPVPTVVRYRVLNEQLIVEDLMRPDDPATVVADGVVQFQVQYGYSQNCPAAAPALPARYTACSIAGTATSVAEINHAASPDAWGDAMRMPAGPTVWRRVIAIRLAVVTRAPEPEKPDPVLGCATTTQLPLWKSNKPILTSSGTPLDVSISNPAGWKCFRYRVTEMTVPLRNFMWFPDLGGFTTPN